MHEKSVNKQVQHKVDACKSERRNLISRWRKNVRYRVGEPFESESDRDRVNVPVDWSATKSKAAQLWSQMPQPVLTPKHPAFAPAVPAFTKELSDALTKADVASAMSECTVDCINAAGIGAAIVAYQATTETIKVPAIDLSVYPPEQQAVLLASPDLPMMDAERVVDRRFTCTRISPEDLIWDSTFRGSNFDHAPLVGRSGRYTWPEAKAAFPKLKDSDKEKVLSADHGGDRIRDDEHANDTAVVTFDEVFYRRHFFHEGEKSFTAIQRVVFVQGLDEPVVDELWNGHRFDAATGRYIGACRFPIRVLTLTYVTDEAIPPSDSEIGRPQVNELILSRSQMIEQRRHSIPLRTYNPDRVDPAVVDAIQRGEWQQMVPVRGNAEDAIREVQRTAFPRESFEFDRVAKSDLQEAWSLGSNQMGAFASGERSASEAGIIERHFATRTGYERDRVASFFVGIVEVMAGLLALYGDFDVPMVGPDPRLQAWDRTQISNEFVYSIRVDSTVRLEAEEQINRDLRLIDYLVKSGYLAPEPIIRNIVALSGHDPDEVLKRPDPKGPEPVNLSVRRAEDFMNPVVLAILARTGQAPTPEELDAAKKMIAALAVPPSSTSDSAHATPAAAAAPDDAFPDWTMTARVNKRRVSDE